LTTIAWDGTTLAADRASWAGGAKRRVRKVFRITREGHTFLVAFMGSQAFAIRLEGWMRGEHDFPACEAYGVDRDSSVAVCIDERRRVFELSATGVWQPFREKVFARGGGQEYAWGALDAGADARTAVLIAARRCDYSAMGVDVVTF
jgi:20S proteasome alpha/beta subunit